MSVACRRCGSTWPRDPAIEVPCPHCRAAVGQKCRRPSAHTAYGDQPHAERDRAAMNGGILEKCPGQPKAETTDAQMTLPFA